MPYFNIVAETSENTVVTQYEPVPKRADSYQSEAALERGTTSAPLEIKQLIFSARYSVNES